MALLWLAGLALAATAAPATQATVTQATVTQAPGTQDFPAEYAALEREFDAAQDAYYEPYSKAKSDAEREKIRLDPAKEPSKVFAARFDDLARRAKGTETGARSLLWIASNVRERGSPAVGNAVDALVADYMDSPVLADLAQWMQYGADAIGAEKARAALEKIAEKSPHADVKANALFSLGAVQYGQGSMEAAIAVFRRLQKDYAGTGPADRAAAYLFEIEKLQVGMPAPDFAAVDENGETFHLADYKGKVVVVDFWGFW